jgi:phage repressor protein C with HTH and peptisase S24 domain
MDIIGRLIDAVDATGLKRVRIAADAGMPASKLTKILKRKQAPTVLEYVAIAQAIHLDPSRLFSDKELVVELETLRSAYEQLKTATDTIERMLPAADPSRITPIPKPRRAHTALLVPAAANPNAEFVVELETVRKHIPRDAWNRGARIIARVVGDSMDGGPDPIRDGELAYLKPTRSPRTANGKVTLVQRNDGLYLKVFELSGHTIRLVSTNGLDPIVLDARHEDNMRIRGYVVAHAPERLTHHPS